jgi:hypothetical protein
MAQALVFTNEMTPEEAEYADRYPAKLKADGIVFQTTNSPRVTAAQWKKVIRSIGSQHVLAIAEANDNNLPVLAQQVANLNAAKQLIGRVDSTIVYYENVFLQWGFTGPIYFPNTTLTWGELEDLRYKYKNAFDNNITVLGRQYVDVDPGSGQYTGRRTKIADALLHRSCKGVVMEMNPTSNPDILQQMNLLKLIEDTVRAQKNVYILLPPYRDPAFSRGMTDPTSTRYDLDVTRTIRLLKQSRYWSSPQVKLIFSVYRRSENKVGFFGTINSVESALAAFYRTA